MTIKKMLLFALFCFSTVALPQPTKEYSIGMLIDVNVPELRPLLIKMQEEIRAVVGEDAVLRFPDNGILTNEYNLQRAEKNYQDMLNSDIDIILAFGVLNNVVVSKQETHRKPTILFGAVNKDMVALDVERQVSGIPNFTYLIASQSYQNDLNKLKELSDFRRVGIAIEKPFIEVLPIKETFDRELAQLKAGYKLIPFTAVDDIIAGLNDIDALYLAGGFFLSDEDIQELSRNLIYRRLPSMTATNIRDVENGLMASNQPAENLDQFVRRIALSVEAHINGTPLAELPIYIDFDNILTMNFNTAQQVGIPIKYSLITNINFVGEMKNAIAEKRYDLLGVVNELLDKNISLAADKKDVLLAMQDLKSAKSNYLPNLSASATVSHLDERVATFGNPEYSASGVLSLQQTLFSEAANAGISVLGHIKKAQQETYNANELDGILNAGNAYFNALINKVNVQIQGQNLELTKRNLRIAEQNFEAGQSGKSDVLRFRSQMAQNTQTFVEAINRLQQAFHSINQLLNNDILYEIDVVDAALGEGVFERYNYRRLAETLDNPVQHRVFTEFLVEEAVRNSPEVAALEHNLAATERNIRSNGILRFLPTAVAQGSYNYTFDQWGTGSLDPDPQGIYSVGVSLSIPIFQQNQFNINRQIAVVQRDQLLLNMDNVELAIAANINNAVLNLVNQISNIELSRVSEETARESLELTQTAYSNGAVTVVELIDAQNNYLQAQLASSNAVYNFLLNALQLERFLGHYFFMKSDAENAAFQSRYDAFLSNYDDRN